VRWIQRAADQGFARAQWDIGMLYAQGNNVRKDPIAAHAWLSLAADGGHKPARRARDDLARGFTPAQRERSVQLQAELRAKIAPEPEPGRATR
jgi:TPR repeat protein